MARHLPDHDNLNHAEIGVRILLKGNLEGAEGELDDLGVLRSAGAHRLVGLHLGIREAQLNCQNRGDRQISQFTKLVSHILISERRI